jgi:hypothetical protein
MGACVRAAAVSKRARVPSTSPTQTDPFPQTRGSRAPLGHTSFYSDMEPGSPFTASPQAGASVAPWPPPPSELKGELHADLGSTKVLQHSALTSHNKPVPTTP